MEFEDRLAERFYNLALDGRADDECSNYSSGFEYTYLFRMRRASVILTENENGFIDYLTTDQNKADKIFERIRSDYTEDIGPQEDDIVTEDDENWYQYGELYHTGDRPSLVKKMEEDKFWPNVFVISDHGNSCLITDFS